MAEDQAIQNQRNAINEGSKTVRNTYLSYLAVTVYIWIAIESITHKQLLIPEDKLQLPVLGIGLPVVGFFFIAPILLLLVHTYFMIHVTQFAHLLDQHRNQKNKSEIWRSEIDPSIFTGFYFRKDSEWGLTEFLRDVFILTSFWCVVPVVLCRIQLKFLPYHHEYFTTMHLWCVLLSIVLAILFYCKIKPMQRNMGFSSWALEFLTVFFKITRKNFPLKWLKGVIHLLILVFSVSTILSVGIFSWDVLSIPKNEQENEAFLINSQGALKRVSQNSFAWIARKTNPKLKDRETGKIKINEVIDRNLILREEKLAPGPGEVLISEFEDQPEKLLKHTKSLNLKDRDLRFADFYDSDLRKADLRGAQLQGAELSEAQLQGTNFSNAQLQDADLRFAVLQGAELIKTKLQGAILFGTQLQGAKLAGTKLIGADLSQAELQGATLFQTELAGANLQNAQLHGANLIAVDLEGAVIFGSHLLGANLQNAQLHGTSFRSTVLQGTNFLNATLGKLKLDEQEMNEEVIKAWAKKIYNPEFRESFKEKMQNATKRSTRFGKQPKSLKIAHSCKSDIDACDSFSTIKTLNEKEILKIRKNIYSGLICELPLLAKIQLKNIDEDREFILSNDEVVAAQKACEGKAEEK